MARRPFRTTAEAYRGITIVKARINLMATALSSALAEVQQRTPESIERAIEILNQARRQHLQQQQGDTA